MNAQLQQNWSVWVWLAAILGSAWSCPADAASETAGPIEEIIVTATRRAQNVQDVPISMNVFSGERLEESRVENMQDIQFLAAGVHVTDALGSMRITIRGIGVNQLNGTAESGSATHRDGVYLGNFSDVGMGFFDVERIEILRGPQGTLYGRNATGGAVNIISRAPTDSFEAGGRVTVGNYSLVETEGYAGGPIVEGRLNGRLAFLTRKNDGYTENLFNGDGYNNADTAAVRARLRYQPRDDLQVDLIADYGRDDGIPVGVVRRGVGVTQLVGEQLGGTFPEGERKVNLDDGQKNDKTSWGMTADVQWDLPWATLKSLTAYRDNSVDFINDYDGTDAKVGTINLLTRDVEQVSQEFTLASTNEKLDWVAGLYYYGSDYSQVIDSVRLYNINSEVDVFSDETNDAYAAFGEGTYHFTDRLSLTLGARYGYEKKALDARVTFNGTQTGRDDLSDDWTAFTPKGALNYAFSDTVMGYVTIGKGFKAGGYNSDATQGRPYDPEEVINYEVGTKTELFDRRLRANLALFYMDYDDLQVFTRDNDPVTGGTVDVVTNAAQSVIKGVELDLQAQLATRLSVDGTVSYLNAQYDDWTDAIDVARGGTFDVSGNPLIHTPKWAVNLGASYGIPLGNWGQAWLRAEYSHMSRVYFTPFAGVDAPETTQEPYDLINASLRVEDLGNRWTLTLWSKNLTDELVQSTGRPGGGALTGLITYVNYLPPRTYGATLDVRI